MYILQDELKLNEWQFSQRKYLPYEIKVKLAEARIREWYENWYGEVYLSYSGGVDSTALLYMIRKVLGDEIPAVFSNTGLEFPEIVRHARKASGNYVEIYPKWKSGKRAYFSEVVDQFGFPLISKETALKVRKLRHGNLGDRTHLGVINVISRLKLYYQENAEVIYMRNETGGTTVKIKIKTASEET